MFTHPEIHILIAKQHENELIEQATRYRLAATASRGRHGRRWGLRRVTSVAVGALGVVRRVPLWSVTTGTYVLGRRRRTARTAHLP
ncbi:MAG TPA: hypothetical protein VF054_12330 [Micromonosporaceae bacterium]